MKYPTNGRRIAVLRLTGLLLLSLGLTACDGSSNGSNGQQAPSQTPPDSSATSIGLLDALPGDGVTLFDPGLPDVTFSHFGYSDFSFAVSGDCSDGTTIQHTLVDVSVAFDALFEHDQTCQSLTATGSFETDVDATRGNGDAFAVHLQFSTTTRTAPDLLVEDSLTTPRDSVTGMFQSFVDDSLVDGLGLPDSVASLIAGSVQDIADSGYGELLNAEPLFGVTAQRVSYASRQPDGSASSELTGLVAFPDTGSSEFTPKDSIIVLSHATAVTPSDLDPADGWFVVANLFASRGYLVIAPDNWGRGGTAGRAETFLMATRTAANSLDMIRAVLADADYDTVRGSGPPTVTLVGYSQGGHTALALWQAIAAQAPNIAVPRAYLGAGPYDLYATARGVVRHADGSCDGGEYCRYVTDQTTVPFLSDRVLTGYVAYAATGLTLGDLVDKNGLTSSFVDGFLGNDPAFDNLKSLLQQSSFTNITAGLDALSAVGTRFTLYHSSFDRLVPRANTEELVSVLEPHFAVDFRTDVCDSDTYRAVFDATDQVGITHALCGFEMLNDVYGELR